MNQDNAIDAAQQIATNAGYEGKDALLRYAANQIDWQKLSEREYVAHHEQLTDEHKTVLHALKQQGQVLQPQTGYYSKDYLTTPPLNQAITASKIALEKKADAKLRAKVYYLTAEKGYRTPLEYAAIAIDWKALPRPRKGFIADAETLSELDKEVLEQLRKEGHIKPKREDGYHSQNYMAQGELQTLLEGMLPAVNEVISNALSR